MKTLLIACTALLLAAAALLGAGFYALRATLAPLPGEWSVPLALGPVTLQAGVPSMLRLATSSWSGPLLAGRHVPTRYGVLHLGWPGDGALQVRCAPCTLQPPGVGEEALVLPDVQLSVQRLGEELWGSFTSGKVRGDWKGRMAAGGLRLRIAIPSTPIADGYALLADDIPELKRARIEGNFSLVADLALPEGTLVLKPRLESFAVSGLGTEAFATARSACSRRASKVTADSWLARAVVAAEDQRFWEHPGYDLVEVGASLARNQQEGRVARGGSTLSQQLAKLLVTGGERSPVRKLRELLYAVEMEQVIGKPRILRLYLDNAPWGEGVCGAEAAAQHYFGVRAHELTVAQAGWLAAMLHNPQLEAQRWAASGRINTARAQWVVLGMRGLSRPRKLELAQAVEDMDWKPWWVQPGER